MRVANTYRVNRDKFGVHPKRRSGAVRRDQLRLIRADELRRQEALQAAAKPKRVRKPRVRKPRVGKTVEN